MARRGHRRYESIVHSHLERVSRTLLEEHPEIVKRFIGRNSGVYALYRKDRLYYVGLTTRLAARLKAHIKDRHGAGWDQFSIYLTVHDQHLKGIEALLLQIARPSGNRVGGKPSGSKDMLRRVQRAVKEESNSRITKLFGRSRVRTPPSNSPVLEQNELAKLFPRGARLRATHKGKEYFARLHADGRPRRHRIFYSSLSQMARAILKRSSNGWWFWQVERGSGNWVRLTKVREAGTVIFKD